MSAASATTSSAAATASATTAAVDAKAAAAPVEQSVLFVSHGAGPCFFMDDDDGFFAKMNSKSPARKWFESAAAKFLPSKPKAILVISAHWETSGKPSVYSQDQTSLFYDYYGFPDSTYEIKYAPPGSPAIAKEVVAALKAGGIECGEEKKRGLDHGSFIPLKMLFPAADIPVLQLSLLSHLEPNAHFALGRALRPLRSKGVLIVGSGQLTHGRPSQSQPTYAKVFDAWATDLLTNPKHNAAARTKALLEMLKIAPYASMAHPRTEHWIPLIVAAGAAGDDDLASAKKIYDDFPADFMSLGCFQFGTGAAVASATTASSSASTTK